ncbi:hypothetical protein [Caldisalinibacter kiritimatiensis]|uniref:S-layer protein n=1 Tax=Caldisalinibacter kiritimatiensis TaxID=1304284 RepID=R1AXH7_9FIRM|nr:hypothetical protein [Caldisalinibacter kiritimatiensis]EOD01898.1 S-layer protein [Caldisalinibacter kiritimatiensis]
MYEIASGAEIEIDNHESDLYGLRLGYHVELELESNYIVKIDAEIRERNDRFEGMVEYVHEDAEIIVLSVNNSNTNEKETITVVVTDDTVYYDEDGTRGSFRHIDKEDKVLVIGSYKDDIFTAKSIILMENNN